ncbi:D-tyrosyl-tRNA(Tyr) deacylase [Elsinoe australis]|uniref:D-tyrosyl-tRNA(Tyr) deacylase n=1 Tax=Elsinoe australis TaxID=40998 RepID=A0A2P7Z465_9PEZI|nr:D-tyrosyl-tRNA(Tyr) deacylase [Elsinoe australis]
MSGKDTTSDAIGSGAYRAHLPDLSIPRFTSMKAQNAHEYADEFLNKGHQPPWLYALYKHWRSLFEEPFRGVTNDGHVRQGLFKLQDEGIPIEDITQAADSLLSKLDQNQLKTVQYHIDSPEWRSWSNPEFLLSDKGLRLDELTPDLRDSILKILQLTLSPEGYTKAISAMRINGFLGHLVDSPSVMNEYSYNFVLFGHPSTTRPWGFSFYGHHLCLNIFLHRTQIFLTPWFTGAEPNEIDTGPYAGTTILNREAALGLELMQSLPAPLRAKAQTYALLHDPAMPPGRWNKDDQRHLCGAYRDNRVVPYEGVVYADLSPQQQSLVSQILEEYLLYLPSKARQMRLDHALSFPEETYFSWIGGYGDEDPFYYRIQNPVVIVEFDHHSGVFLANQEPKKFHIHTLLRTPNAGDYGMAIRGLVESKEDCFVWDGK